MHKGPLDALMYHESHGVFQLRLSSPDSVCPSCLQIRSPGGPYLDCSPSDLFGWGLLYMRGGEHGRKIWSICHAYCTRSVQLAPCMWCPLTTAQPSPLYTAHTIHSRAADFLSFEYLQDSCSEPKWRTNPASKCHKLAGCDFYLSFYPDLVFIIVPQADRQNNLLGFFFFVCVWVFFFLNFSLPGLRSYNVCRKTPALNNQLYRTSQPFVYSIVS